MNPNTPAGNGQPTPSPVPGNQPGQPQPVAYDQQGRPLYLHPPTQQAPAQPNTPQMVYLARPMDPEKVPVSAEVLRRHEEARRKYPSLNLSDGEYIISAVKRHPIGVLRIWAIVLFMIIAFGAVAFMFFANGGLGEDSEGSGLPALVAGSLGMVYMLIILGGMAATYVYENNRFFLTNESVIQEIQTSLFSKHEQTVSLANIEDASYRQTHIVQSIFNYGTIRLSTEGDETTYIFDYVANPKKHIATLNNAVEAFKNGRPVLAE